jgi:endonuclease/exonuclease/phosphatase (EEP) superfamily protein YafD
MESRLEHPGCACDEAVGGPARNAPCPTALRRALAGGTTTRIAASAIAAFYGALLFAACCRSDVTRASALRDAASLMAFYVDTFAFHGGIAAAAACVVLALGHRWALALAGLPAVVLSVGPSLLAYLPRPQARPLSPPLTVMTTNLYGSNDRPETLAAEMAQADPDILLLQEYTAAWHEVLSRAIGDRYAHVAILPREDCYGLAVYSKIPIEPPGVTTVYPGGLSVPCLKLTVRIGGQAVMFFNAHLVPPKSVAHFRQQCAQFADLLTEAAKARPSVLAGDFNFTERSAFGRRLRKARFRSTHQLAGWGRAPTWPNQGLLPGVRIDHVYLSSGLTCFEARPGVGTGSDHRPVLVRIGTQPPNG